MNFIEGLKQYTAIKVGEKYVVQLQVGYSSTEYLVNGVGTTAKQVVVDDLECIYSASVVEKTLSHYTDGNKDMPVEGYKLIANNMSEYWNDDLEEFEFPSLEVEYELKKEKEKIKYFSPVYNENTIPPKKIDITLVGEMVDTGSGFISTSFSLGKASFGEDGVFKVAPAIQIAMDEFRKVVSEKDIEHELPTHGGLRYAKVLGKYLFNDRDLYVSDRNTSPKLCKTLKEAKEYEQTIRNYIKKHILTFCNMNKVDPACVSEIYSDLKNLLNSVYGLDVKQRSSTSKSSVTSSIKKIMEKLEVL